jgi:hypothetical protein
MRKSLKAHVSHCGYASGCSGCSSIFLYSLICRTFNAHNKHLFIAGFHLIRPDIDFPEPVSISDYTY